MISPEFETELVKKALGQPAGLSRHGAADRQFAHENCFNIDDKMLPYLLGADLSSGCAILRVFHKEILASTAEHTATLLERFAKPVLCWDKTKLFLTLRHWLTDLEELQAAGSSPSKQTVVRSLKRVTGGVRNLNNLHEITDLLAPNDPGKLYSAIERKAAEWAVMDADIRLSVSTAGAGKGAKGDHKGAYSATIPCKHHAKGTCETSADTRTKVQIRSPAARAADARKRTSIEIGARSVDWANSCPEVSYAQVVLTSPLASSSSEAAPPGLPAPVNNGANSEDVVALAAILRDVLSPSGPFESSQATRLATLARSAGEVVRQKFPVDAARDQTKHLSTVVNSVAEVHVVCPAHEHLM